MWNCNARTAYLSTREFRVLEECPARTCSLGTTQSDQPANDNFDGGLRVRRFAYRWKAGLEAHFVTSGRQSGDRCVGRAGLSAAVVRSRRRTQFDDKAHDGRCRIPWSFRSCNRQCRSSPRRCVPAVPKCAYRDAMSVIEPGLHRHHGVRRAAGGLSSNQ